MAEGWQILHRDCLGRIGLTPTPVSHRGSRPWIHLSARDLPALGLSPQI